jgi:uncharacterized membrane protein YeaQ/YmgE (transglycosylase-associated protein family)
MGCGICRMEKRINPYIWCAVGGLVGWLIGAKTAGQGNLSLIENVLVGVFGAFVGGDLLVSQLNGGVIDDKVFHMSSLLLAIAGAVASLMALRLLRHVVGPMRSGKSKSGDR